MTHDSDCANRSIPLTANRALTLEMMDADLLVRSGSQDGRLVGF